MLSMLQPVPSQLMTVCRSEWHRAAVSQTDDISVTVACNNDVMTLVRVHSGAEHVGRAGY